MHPEIPVGDQEGFPTAKAQGRGWGEQAEMLKGPATDPTNPSTAPAKTSARLQCFSPPQVPSSVQHSPDRATLVQLLVPTGRAPHVPSPGWSALSSSAGSLSAQLESKVYPDPGSSV